LAKSVYGYFWCGVPMSDNQDWYSDLQKMQRKIEYSGDAVDYDTRRPRRRLSPLEREYNESKEIERQYTMSRKLKSLREKQQERNSPVRSRIKAVGTRAYGEVERSYRKTNRRGVGRIRKMISGAFNGSNGENIRSGLSTIVDEVSRSWIPQFSRSMLGENNPECDFFGESQIDMNNLISSQNKKTGEVFELV